MTNNSKVTEISSSSNALYRTISSLLTAKGLKKESKFILSGKKIIEEFLASNHDRFHIENQIVRNGLDPLNLKVPILKLAPELFKELDVLGTHFPLLLIRFDALVEKQQDVPPKGLEIVCPLGDPRNLGALARSALAFGVSELLLTQESAHPFLPHTIKSSAGAILKMPIKSIHQKLSDIHLKGPHFALDLNGQAITDVKWPKDLRLWVGEEGPGLEISKEFKREFNFITIPIENVESLNAMVSVTLAIWDWKNKK